MSCLIDWRLVDWVLIDMDGTLLDKHFDDYFWEEFVPIEYARMHGIEPEVARRELLERYAKEEGKLKWTDLDFWSEELGMDIPLLKKEVEHLIQVHPYTIEFLEYLRDAGKRRFLVTNAHSKTLDLKMAKTRIGGYFNGIYSAFDIGLPKEDVRFWEGLYDRIGFDKGRTILIEDSEDNLRSASSFGIKYLIFVARPNNRKEARPSSIFPSISSFKEIIPSDGS